MNDPGDTLFAITREQFEEAAARAGETGHELRVGDTEAEYREGMLWADVLLAQTSTLYGRFPVEAPNLKMISSAVGWRRQAEAVLEAAGRGAGAEQFGGA
jgi:hypothetical protein